ncbi:unnamed protein product [Linum tenue]|uniref:Uncharacterized protein n=1 Tax=Linum tenue TaxID=586396 RepID=A0AAV0M880_9ROSI|nr:unnamed protein product [Linum tenue]
MAEKKGGSMAVTGKDQQDSEITKPVLVRVPNARPAVSPMEVQVSENTKKTHNPVIIWQVYALGGFIVLQWVWARWNERKERAKKRSSAEENQTPDDHSPAEGEE